MKFTTVVLASAFVVSGTFAFAQGYGNPNGSPGGRTSLSGTGSSTYGGDTPGAYGRSVRRHDRRAAYGYGYGPGVVGAGVAGAAAVGTAAAVAATSPGWGWGGGYQPAYYGGAGYQSGVWGPVSSKDYDLYIKNLRDAGYDPKNNYNANGTIKVQ